MARERRRRFLIQKRVQLSFALLVGACAGAVLLLHGLLVLAGLARGATEEQQAAVGAAVLRATLAAGLVLVPLSVSVAVLSTHRLLGPLYRFDRFLRDVLAGREQRPCGIRRHDELQELCALLNEVTAERRERNAARGGPERGPESNPDAVRAPLAARGAEAVR